ncbi:MAG: helix-turn-helix domain-containing protein [Anaerolineales bacterium]
MSSRLTLHTPWYPTFDNVDVFVGRLARAGLMHFDPAISDALARDEVALPARSMQRRFLAVTGMSQTALRQIGRARLAAKLLRQGVSIADVTYQLDYYDQAHLTRLLRRLIGHTPARLQSPTNQPPLSII